MTPELLRQLVLVLVTLMLSLTVHEFSHAAVARWLGDDTAERQGRYTLNPISHVDPFGSLLLPGMLVFMQAGFFFGWANPVPFDASRFRRDMRRKHGILLTAAAGPLSNLLLAALCALLMRPLGGVAVAMTFLSFMVILNVTLFFFNLLPIPPLDGSKVAYGMLPDRAHPMLDTLREHQWIAPVALIAVIFFAGEIIGVPIWVLSGFLARTLGGAPIQIP